MGEVIDITRRLWPSLSFHCAYLYLWEGVLMMPCCNKRTDVPAGKVAPCDPAACPVLKGDLPYQRRQEESLCTSTS